MPKATLLDLTHAALTLGQEGRLYDPSDSDVLIYAAEACNDYETDLSRLDPYAKRQIIDAYDRGTGL